MGKAYQSCAQAQSKSQHRAERFCGGRTCPKRCRGEQRSPLHIHCAVIAVCTMNGKMCVRGAGRRGRRPLQVWQDSFYGYQTMLLPWACFLRRANGVRPYRFVAISLCLTFFIQFSSYIRGVTFGIMPQVCIYTKYHNARPRPDTSTLQPVPEPLVGFTKSQGLYVPASI